jgi:hypothetical protein
VWVGLKYHGFYTELDPGLRIQTNFCLTEVSKAGPRMNTECCACTCAYANRKLQADRRWIIT